MKKLIPILMFLSLFLVACGRGEKTPEPATYDIRGTWEYAIA